MRGIEPVEQWHDGSCYLYDARMRMDNWPGIFHNAIQRDWSPRDPQARGRGAVIRTKIGSEWAIVRHYRRGGWYAALTDDRYLWTGLKNSRPVREWGLLAQLYEAGFPVPRPIATRIERKGFWYRADLITAEISDARTLAEVLESEPLSDESWQCLGKTLGRFHDAGIYHSDLNANNILVDKKSSIYLIDFDKSGFRIGGSVWKRRNIARLKRSLSKLSHQRKIKYWRERDFMELLSAYRLMEP